MDLHSKMTMYITSTMTSPVTKTAKTSKWLRLNRHATLKIFVKWVKMKSKLKFQSRSIIHIWPYDLRMLSQEACLESRCIVVSTTSGTNPQLNCILNFEIPSLRNQL